MSVPVRRLVLELGIEGDLGVLSKLEEVAAAATSVTKTLKELEIQMETLGRAGVGVGGVAAGVGGIVGAGAVMTQSERAASRKTEQAIRDQSTQQKAREEKQLAIAEKQASLQQNIIKALEAQAAGQRGLINQIINESKADRTMIVNVLTNISGLITGSEEYVQKAPRPLHKVGRPPEKYEYYGKKGQRGRFSRIRPEWIAYQAEKTKLESGLGTARRDLPSIIKDLQDPTKLGEYRERLKEFEIEASLAYIERDFAKMEFDKQQEEIKRIVKTLDDEDIKPYMAEPSTKPAFTAQQIGDVELLSRQLTSAKEQRRLKKIQKLMKKAVLPGEIAKPTKKEVEAEAAREALLKKKADIIVKADAEIAVKQEKIALGQAESQKKTDKSYEQLSKLAEKAQKLAADRSINLVKQVAGRLMQAKGFKVETNVPDALMRMVIARTVEEEDERADLMARITKKRVGIEEEVAHERGIKDRGFAFMPYEKLWEASRWAKRKLSGFGGGLKKKAIGLLTKLPGFKSAGEYIKEREERREQMAEEFEKSTEGQQLLQQYNFVFHGAHIDTDERMDQLRRDIILGLRGL